MTFEDLLLVRTLVSFKDLRRVEDSVRHGYVFLEPILSYLHVT